MKQEGNYSLAEFVRANYSWEVVGKQMKSFFEKMNH